MADPIKQYRFDGKSPSAQRIAAKRAASAVKGISLAVKKTIRTVIVRSFREGIAPYDVAKIIRSTIGLTAKQAQGVMDYRSHLLDSGHAVDRIDAMVDKYADRLLSVRATTIARTEIMDALNAGIAESFRDAQEMGYLGPDAKKQWIITPLDTCPACESYAETTVPLMEDFEEGDPPLHPNCRCTIAVLP